MHAATRSSMPPHSQGGTERALGIPMKNQTTPQTPAGGPPGDTGDGTTGVL